MHTQIHNKDITQLYRQLKKSATKRGIDFNLTISELLTISFPITCPVLKIPLYFNRGKAKDNSYSVDRIDSTKGYSIDNIVIVSNRVNKLKSNASLKELENIVDFYKNNCYTSEIC